MVVLRYVCLTNSSFSKYLSRSLWLAIDFIIYFISLCAMSASRCDVELWLKLRSVIQDLNVKGPRH